MYNVVNTLAASFLIESSSFLQVTRTTINAELAALEHLQNFLLTHNGRNVVNTLVPLFVIGSSLFLQETRTGI